MININNTKINGMLLLERKFPSLTKRQCMQVFADLSKNKKSLDSIHSVHIANPDAKLREPFIINYNLN